MEKGLVVKTKQAIAFIIAVIVLVAAVFVAITKTTTKVASVNELERKVELTYDQLSDEDEFVDSSKHVKFGAFFTRDLDGDGYAEKILGSCNDVKSSDSLYIEIGVEQGGYLKDGVITLSNNNFRYKVDMFEDSVLSKDYYTYESVNRIDLKDVYSGTQELIMGDIRSSVASAGDYSKTNTVTLSAIYVAEDETEIPIEKTYNIVIDWYGTAYTKVESKGSNSYRTSELDQVLEDESKQTIDLQYNFIVNTYGLITDHIVGEATVPTLAGYYPTSVSGGTYDEENHKINISGGNGMKTITLSYPKQAYQEMKNVVGTDRSKDTDSVQLISYISVHSLCYNNPKEGFENPYQTSDASTTVAINIKAKDGNSFHSHECEVRLLNSDYINYPRQTRAISKKMFLDEYDKENPESIDYNIQWMIKRVSSDYLSTTIQIDDASSFGDSLDRNLYLQNYTQTKSIAFLESNIIDDDGFIEIYETSGENKLVKKFENGEWKKYTRSNPYEFETPINDIRIVTSNDLVDSFGTLKVVLNRELDINAMKENDMRSYFENAKEFVTGASFRGSTLVNIFSPDDVVTLIDQKSVATIDANPNTLSTANQIITDVRLTINVPAATISTAEWTNGTFLVRIPSTRIAIINMKSVTCSDPDVKISGYELYKEDDNYFIKIVTESEKTSGFNIYIDCGMFANPIASAYTEDIAVYYTNPECPVYYSQTIRDYMYVGVDFCDLHITAPSSFASTETITDYNEDGDVNVAPNIALVTKGRTSAKVNVLFANNYKNSVSNVKILGKIPFEGNTYVEGEDLKSEYTATMKNEGITVPESLSSVARVYYTENATPNGNVEDESNGWKTKEELNNDLSSVKSYLIVITTDAVKRGTIYNFSYDVNVPQDVASNKVAYACHKVFFDLNTDGGILESSVQPNKVGLRIVRFYDMSIDKIKKGTDKPVQGAIYQLLEDDGEGNQVNGRIATSDEQGKIDLKDLRANQVYYFKEIQAPKSCELNEKVIKFVVNENAQGNLEFELKSEEGFDGEVGFVSGTNGRKVLTSKVEDTPKVRLTITKVDKDSGEVLSSVVFGIKDGISATTNSEGKAVIEGIKINKSNILQELIEKRGYYLADDEIEFKVELEDGVPHIISDNPIFQNAQIQNTGDSDYIEIAITITNEKIPTYKLKVEKVNEYDESVKIPNTRFMLKEVQSNRIRYYRTDENGIIDVSDLYQYVEGKNITGEYVLQEVEAANGYLENKEEITFVVSKKDMAPDTTGNEGDEDNQSLLQIEIKDEDKLLNLKSTEVQDDTVKIVVSNKPLYRIKKVDKDTGAPLAGVDFVIYELDATGARKDFAKDNNGNYVGALNDNGDYIVTTNSIGLIVVPLRSGYYEIKEYSWLPGYQQIQTSEKFQVEGKRVNEVEIPNHPTIENSSYGIKKTITADCIEDLVDMSIATDNGEDYGRTLIKLTRTLDFENPSSYKNAEDTSYGDLNGNGQVETILEELTNKEGKGFTPIGNTNAFCGIFIGQGYEIKNLYINKTEGSYAGLFGLLGYSSSVTAKVEDLTLTGTIKANNVDYVGSIVAYSAAGTVVDCHNKANITATNAVKVAGIGNVMKIHTSDNSGNVELTSNRAENVSASGIGGNNEVRNCYNKGNVTVSGTANKVAAGISQAATVTCCYNTGNIVANASADEDAIAQPISANSERENVVNSYYLEGITITGTQSNEEDHKTSEEMRQADFVATLGKTIWKADSSNQNDGYPMLRTTVRINSVEDLVRFSQDTHYADDEYVNNGNAYEGIVVTLSKSLDFNDDSSYDNPNDTSFGDYNGDGTISGIKSEITDETSGGLIIIGRSINLKFIFDGNNNEISGFKINAESSSDVAVFYCLENAQIRNLTLSGEIPHGSANSGFSADGYGYNIFENCTNNCTINGGGYCGGIAGRFDGSRVIFKNCTNHGNITGTNYTGGIIGYATRTAVIEDCKNYAPISGGYGTGGLAGELDGTFIIGSYNYGNVSQTGYYQGGLVGITLRRNAIY